MVVRAGGGFGEVCMVVAVRWGRVMVGTVVVFSTAKVTRGRQRVVKWGVVRVGGKVWWWVWADMSGWRGLGAGPVQVVRATLAVPHQIWRGEGLVGVGAVVLAQIHVWRRSSWVGAGRWGRPVVPVGARSPIEAVTVRHEESTVTTRLSTALGPVPVSAGTRPTEPQCPGSFRGQGISIIQDGSLSLPIPVSLYASKKTCEVLSLLSGRRRRTNRLLLAVRMDRRLVQMDGMAWEGGVRTLTAEMIRSIVRKTRSWDAAIGRGERTRAWPSTFLYLSVETAIYRTSGVGNIWDQNEKRTRSGLRTHQLCKKSIFKPVGWLKVVSNFPPLEKP